MRFIYLGYYISEMNWPLLKKFYRHVLRNTNYNFFTLLLDNIFSVFRYNISILEFFQFGFHEKVNTERLKWAGTGFMYETIQKLNPKEKRYKLEDKLFFLDYYKPFVSQQFSSLANLKNGSGNFKFDRKLVLKHSKGQCGRGVEVFNEGFSEVNKLVDQLEKMKNDMVEEYIYQHDDLSALSPSGLNTLRVITTINQNGDVDILGVRLRISINSHVDNLAAGNVAAPVDEVTGIVCGPGVYSDITKSPEYSHPLTGVKIEGFRVPRFNEAIDLAKNAALFDTDNRSVGWDIAISKTGTSLLEGNHDWCKLVWQLPVNKGLKKELQKYV